MAVMILVATGAVVRIRWPKVKHFSMRTCTNGFLTTAVPAKIPRGVNVEISRSDLLDVTLLTPMLCVRFANIGYKIEL